MEAHSPHSGKHLPHFSGCLRVGLPGSSQGRRQEGISAVDRWPSALPADGPALNSLRLLAIARSCQEEIAHILRLPSCECEKVRPINLFVGKSFADVRRLFQAQCFRFRESDKSELCRTGRHIQSHAGQCEQLLLRGYALDDTGGESSCSKRNKNDHPVTICGMGSIQAFSCAASYPKKGKERLNRDSVIRFPARRKLLLPHSATGWVGLILRIAPG